MLIDSGNSHSISEHVAALLQGVTNSAHVTKVRVTDGGILHSSADVMASVGSMERRD
jgi:hypothetical protein